MQEQYTRTGTSIRSTTLYIHVYTRASACLSLACVAANVYSFLESIE